MQRHLPHRSIAWRLGTLPDLKPMRRESRDKRRLFTGTAPSYFCGARKRKFRLGLDVVPTDEESNAAAMGTTDFDAYAEGAVDAVGNRHRVRVLPGHPHHGVVGQGIQGQP